jgi:hypothetical protein
VLSFWEYIPFYFEKIDLFTKKKKKKVVVGPNSLEIFLFSVQKKYNMM